MLVRFLALAAFLPFSLIVTGCACPRGGCGVPRTPCAPCINDLSTPEQELPSFVELTSAETIVPLPAPTETYELLDAMTCQCRAATNLTAANLVELERYWAKIVISCDTKNVRENLCLDRDLLALRSTGLRNEAAGAALRSFYQLAGLETQKHYLQMGIDEARLTLDRIDRMEAKGIELPAKVDRSGILDQIAELEDKKLELDFLRIQLNGQLQKLTGCPLDEYTFYWPDIDWQPDLMPVDVECELVEGLSTRADLRGLNLVLCQLEKRTLPVARGVLKFAESTIGTVEPQDGVIHWLRCRTCNDTEVHVRCRQLALFYTDTKQTAIAEIKGAAYQIGLQQQRVVSAQSLVEQLENEVRGLEETRDVDDISIFEISNTKARIFTAKSKLLEQVVGLKVARVALREAQGKLAIECGFCPTLCLEGCCDGACVRCGRCGGQGCVETRRSCNATQQCSE